MSKNKKDGEELKSKFVNILKLIVIVALGLVLLFYPGQSLDTGVKALGIVIIVAGAVALISAMTAQEKNAYVTFQIVGAVLGLVAGIIVLVNRGLVISIFPVLTGVGLAIYGAFGIAQAITFKKYYTKGWEAPLLFSIITILVGVLIAANPFSTMNTIVRLIGIVLTYNGVVGIWMQLNRRKKNLVYHKNEIIDVEAIEVDDDED
ncbi:MAG: DUF308 domain-containing protein [Lachnospiraceae bacterium]|nr:DUF308 domain-containing protein [Lachnospiraceae bacterium]